MLSGHGDKDGFLSDERVREIVAQGLPPEDVRGQKLLFIIPDSTRTCPLPLFFRLIFELYGEAAKQIAYLVALGTHLPMEQDKLNTLVGITAEERAGKYRGVGIFNHEWQRPETFRTLGTIPAEEMAQFSDGQIELPIEVRLNRMIFDYDLVTILGPVFPHEVVGVSGGNKYFFPGIAAGDIIHLSHWLGALHTNMNIIGVKNTPVRDVINRAASMLELPKRCMAMVVTGDGLKGLYVGTPEEAWSAAADLSLQVHVRYFDRPFQRVLSCSPTMYDDLWTGAKCMYKLEPVVADGGELIIYAPHIDEVSYVHGEQLDAVGYHVRDYFVKQEARFAHVDGCIKAHSTHVKGAGTYENGVETPRVNVTLATGIPRERCEKINLGYLDYREIDPTDWSGREAEGLLHVPHAGEFLHRLRTPAV